jgi:hypothetical protein
MGLIKLAQILAALLPLIQQGVQTVEQIYPATGAGKDKLSSVMTMVNNALPAVNATAQEVQQLQGPLTQLVNTVVAGFNAAGIFKKS